MATIVVIGGDTLLGQAVDAALTADGHRVTHVTSHTAHTSQPRAIRSTAAPDAPATPDVAQLRAADAVVLVATDVPEAWIDACVAARCPVVDVASEQHAVARYRDRFGDLPHILGAGLQPGIAELLLAATRDGFNEPVTAVTTAYTMPDRGLPPVGFRGSVGRRRAVAETLMHGGQQLRHGALVTDALGERRVPVWFPRPVGPQYALGWPSVSLHTLPAELPDMTRYEHFMAVGGWRAEVLQALANNAARPRFAQWLTRRANTPTRTADPASVRWACVTEMHGEHRFRRAWAYGRDPYQISAAVAAVAAARLLDGAWRGRSLFAAANPSAVLDTLTRRTGMRWVVTDASERRS